MTAPRPARSLRWWLTCALLCIIALPPLAIWAAHAASATTTGPDARTIAAARSFAAANVTRWTEPAWRDSARGYFTAQQVDAELRPARGPWFSVGSAPAAVASVDPGDKFVVRAPGEPGTILGSGWVIPHLTTHIGWTLPLTAGALTLALTVGAAGAFLGRHVVRPLAAVSRAAGSVPYAPDGGRIDLDCARRPAEATFAIADTGPGIAPADHPHLFTPLFRGETSSNSAASGASSAPSRPRRRAHRPGLRAQTGRSDIRHRRHRPRHRAADLPHLFTPLFRGETSRNRATGGAGLGLAIAQRIVHAHHGTITAHNIAPHGVRFTVRIPSGPAQL